MKATYCHLSHILVGALLFAVAAVAADDRIRVDRIKAPVDPARTVVLKGHLHQSARAEFDQGSVDPAMQIAYAALYLRPAEGLESFLADQQMPSSPNFHKWLTPEEFGDRFGATGNDLGNITGWLKAAGFTVHDVARGRHWVTFSGTAAQVSRAFHTEIHKYLVNGVPHFANSTDISIPAALESSVLGIDGLTDFRLEPLHGTVSPHLTSGGAHYLAPDDLATIYDLTPLYNAGIDGAGQKIALLGTSDILLSDMATARAHFNLPPNPPKVVLYGPDPGTNSGGLGEANLDLQVSGAIARNASLIYVNAASVSLAALYAVDQNIAPVLSMSYGGCELTYSAVQTLHAVAQQANAQGITWMVSSGDSAAATCDRSSPTPQATKGQTVSAPASFPEVTAVGGTQFDEGTGTYWSATNTANRGSALSYIPERAWNDGAQINALDGGGGGASAYFPKPAWQTGPGVPNDGARDLPDVSFASAYLHDGFEIYYQGGYYSFGGTSASSPLFAGIVALLNQSLKTNGLGNINPVLYQLAQSTTDVFHDIVNGDIIVPCAQGSPDCVNGQLGFAAGPGYDQATGLGSVDAARLIAEWNSGAASTTTITATPASVSLTDTVQLTATVTGKGAAPTGSVTFVAADLTLGSAKLTPGSDKTSTASLSTSAINVAGNNLIAGALYTGDANYLPSGGSVTLALKLPASGSLVVPTVTPNPVYQVGTTWPYLVRLTELAGVATKVTVFTVNGVNNLGAFSSLSIPAHGSIAASLAGGGLTVPLNRVYHFEGADADGTPWIQELTIPFTGPIGPTRVPGISVSVSPSTMQQNPQADPSCQWSQQVTLQETGGYATTLTSVVAGAKSLTSTIAQYFGTARIAPWGTLTGKFCYASAAASSQTYSFTGASEAGTTVTTSATVTFAPAAAAPATFQISTPSVSIALPAGTSSGSSGLDLKFGSGSPAWSATVLQGPQKWLSVSSLLGTGNETVQVLASTAGLSNGVYNAVISFQAQDTVPQAIQVPVTLVVGASPSISINGIGNAASGSQSFAPGQLLAVYGSNLAAATQIAQIQPLPYTMSGASATVNGVSAPLWFVSAGQINLQIPYETPLGAAVLGINNGGAVTAYSFNVSPAAPGLFASNGFLVPYNTAQAGQTIAAFITGDGDVTPTLATGATPGNVINISQYPKSRQALSLTVGGQPATVVFNGIVTGLIGVTQVNFTVPATVAAGVQPVVVTVGGVSSAPVNLTVTAASSSTL
jgi:uncharacterized protein (TIGR03437 family)